MEFCGKRDDTHQIAARTTALCIVLPLASTKELLLNDNRFLRYLLNSVTEKLMLYSSSQSNFSTLEESFLSYLLLIVGIHSLFSYRPHILRLDICPSVY